MRGVVIDRPVFKSAEYLAELVRRQKRRAEEQLIPAPIIPPPAPASAFILGDEIIECEEAEA